MAETLGHSMYLVLVPTGVVIGHVGIAAKILPRVAVLDPLSRWLAHLWVVAVVGLWGLRSAATGRLPMVGPYESALSLAVATVLVGVAWEHWGRRRVPLSPLAVLTAAAVMSHGRRFEPAAHALSADLAGWPVSVHAVVAWIAFAIFALNSFAALRLLLGRGAKPPELEVWLVVSLKLGFVLHLAVIVSGALCRQLVEGRLWSFDPVESAALVVWLGYGALLLLHRMRGWAGKRLAVWSLVVFVLMALSFRGIAHLAPGASFHAFGPGAPAPAEASGR